ncbi:MAG: hypothetical protein DBX59_04110 [Bacillota bacterium]|nr:MAG: hypothetical protein DBX59_04110 [Bacillota bacterium]
MISEDFLSNNKKKISAYLILNTAIAVLTLIMMIIAFTTVIDDDINLMEFLIILFGSFPESALTLSPLLPYLIIPVLAVVLLIKTIIGLVNPRKYLGKNLVGKDGKKKNLKCKLGVWINVFMILSAVSVFVGIILKATIVVRFLLGAAIFAALIAANIIGKKITASFEPVSSACAEESAEAEQA